MPQIIHPLFVVIYSVDRQAKNCPCACHEGIYGSGGTASFINYSTTRWAIKFMPKLVQPKQKNPCYPSNMSLISP